MRVVKIAVAGHRIQLTLPERYAPFIEKTHQPFFFEGKPQVYIDVELENRTTASVHCLMQNNILTVSDEFSSASFDVGTLKGRIAIDPLHAEWCISLYVFLRALLSLLWVVKDKGLLLHAACVVKYDAAYIFVGPSGAGKSTVARLSADKTVVDEEVVFIKEQGEDFFVFPTPAWGTMQETGKKVNRPYPIAGIFKLIKDNAVYIEKIPPALALADMYSIPALFGKWAPQEELFSSFCQLIKKVPYYGLHFLPEPSFWTCIDTIEALQYSQS